MIKKIILIALCCLSIACSAPPKRYIDPESVALATNNINLDNEQAVLSALNTQHKNWKGTPYQFGGLTKKGIDCSGFVYRTYKESLGHSIPRSTELLAASGSNINKSDLRPGDLVFFKTSTKVRHVGIYMNNGSFLHASTSKGVMISKLDNPYWKGAYWKAKRIDA
jgi:cell wall-associated NlpC family hydrolase